MSATAPTALRDVEVLRNNTANTQMVLKRNLEGLTHEDSLVQPDPAGNCLNWVVGHLLCVYNEILPLLGKKPVIEPSDLKRYARGAAPLLSPDEAVRLDELTKALDETVERFDSGLVSLTQEALDKPAPYSPTNNPNETVRSLLALISFHQAYHVGQTGLLRRIVGKAGAIA